MRRLWLLSLLLLGSPALACFDSDSFDTDSFDNTAFDFECSDPVSSFDLTGLPSGWEPYYDISVNQYFVTIKQQECDGDGNWAAWRAGTAVTPRGSSNCRVDEATVRQEADGAAVWARWAPGTTSRNSANLQINIRQALTDDFVPN